MAAPRRRLRGIRSVAVVLLGASTAAAQPPPGTTEASPTITRRELLKRVDKTTLVEKHHIDPGVLAQMDLRMLLSIDAIDPPSPKAGGGLRVTYTLTNLTLAPARGTTIGLFQGRALVGPDGSPPGAIDLAPGLSATFDLRAKSPILEGTDTLVLSYRDGVTCHTLPGPYGKPIDACVAAVTSDARADVTVTSDVDTDQDGLPDALETQLLARFRPYYRFSMNGGDDEDWHPADAGWFVRHSELQDHHTETDTPLLTKDQLAGTPSLILDATSIGSSRISARPEGTSYYLNVFNPYRGGEADWSRIVTEGTGLYGHVAPLRLDPCAPEKITAYKIEYWQFYAFDYVPGQIECVIVAGPAGGSDAHEGDWEGVQLVVDATPVDATPAQTIRRVRHNVHSTDVVFEIAAATPAPIPLGEGFVEYQGPNADTDRDLFIARESDDRHNSLLRLFCNEDGCTHPVVYIEHAGHASWPTAYWTWPGVLNHDGNSPHAYLVVPPVNLGEVDHPNPTCPSCALVLGFNGHWGSCGRDPPHGPPLQGSWNVP